MEPQHSAQAAAAVLVISAQAVLVVQAVVEQVLQALVLPQESQELPIQAVAVVVFMVVVIHQVLAVQELSLFVTQDCKGR